MDLSETLTVGAQRLCVQAWNNTGLRAILDDALAATGRQGFVVATLVLDGRRGDDPPRLTATLSSHGGSEGSLSSRPVVVPNLEDFHAC